jgi:hypothetical protein
LNLPDGFAERREEIVMRVPMIAFIFTAMLTACTTTEQHAQYMVNQIDYMVQVYGPACDKLGYARNTDGWRDCVVNLSARDYGGGYYGYYGYGYPSRYWYY